MKRSLVVIKKCEEVNVQLLRHLEWGAPVMPSGCWTPCLLRKRKDTELAKLRRTPLHFGALNYPLVSFTPIAHYFNLTWRSYFGLGWNMMDASPSYFCLMGWKKNSATVRPSFDDVLWRCDVFVLIFCSKCFVEDPFLEGLIEWVICYFSLYKVQYPREGAEQYLATPAGFKTKVNWTPAIEAVNKQQKL